jgi:hypothetical protein
MKNLLFAGATVCAAALLNASAQAQYTYVCQYWGPRLIDGDTVTRYWRVVLGSIHREEIPGKPDRSWCRISFAVAGRGFWGNFKSFEVLEAPKNGQFRVYPTSVVYKGMRVGPDKLVVKQNWLSSTNNQPMSGTVNIEIEVVDHPL